MRKGILGTLRAALWLVLLLACTSSVLAQSWYNTSWLYRKKITIDHTKVGTVGSTDQSNFPVLVSLTSDAGLSAHALSTGYDILFTDSTGTTKIPYERESYASGTLVAWVKVATLSHTTDTVIYLYYGNSSASDQQDATHAVWDSSFKAVWHLKEATGATSADSTANGYNATPLNSPTQGAAKIDGGLTFNGSASGMEDDVSSAFGLGTANVTMECWAYLSSSSVHGAFLKIGGAGEAALGSTAPGDGYAIGVGSGAYETNGNHVLALYERARWIDAGAFTGTIPGWHHFVLMVNASGYPYVYYDGAQLFTDAVGAPFSPVATNHIGGYTGSAGENRHFGGTLDEVRVSSTIRSPDWINTEFNNQNSPSTFYALGSEGGRYTWNVSGSGDWQTAANWTPTRTSPSAADVLIFNTVGSTVTDIPAQTIGQLLISGGVTLNFTAAATGNILTVNDVLTTTSSDTLNLGSGLVLGGTLTSLTNGGKIQTAVLTATSAAPIPASLTWGGTVEYNGAGAQTAVGGTYTTLKVNNATGVTLAAAATITTLTIGDVTASSIFNDGGFVITPGASSVLNLTSGTYNLGSATVGTAWPAWATRNITAGTTVGYVSALAQAVSTTPSYPNLTFSGAGAKTPAAGTLTVGGNWSVTGGTATLTSNPIVTVTGDLTGTGSIGADTALITVGGNWLNTGTFTAGTGGVTLTGTGMQITGASGLTFLTLTVNGTYTNNNPGTLTVSTALSGSGTLTQPANATLSIGGTAGISGLDATSYTPNTVNYSGGAQTVKAVSYYHLALSGSLAKTLTSVSTINGNLTMSGSATATTATTMTVGGNVALSGTSTLTTGAGLTITGNLSVGDGTTFTAGAFALTVSGTTTVGAGTSGNLTISSASGTKIFTGLVTVNSGGTWANTSANSPVTFRGGITLNGTGAFNAGTGVNTFDTNTQTLTGTFTIPSVTVTGVTLNNNGTLTVSTALAGTGGLTQGASATLNIGASAANLTLATLTATASPNTVNYNASGVQTVVATTYNNLTLSGSGAKTMTGVTTIGGNLTISGTATMTGNAGFTVTGALNYSSTSGTTTLTAATPISIGTFSQSGTGGTLADNGNTITVTGTGASTWVLSAGTFTATGTALFTGAAPQIGAANFYNLSLGGSASATTAGAVTVGGNLNVQDGTTFTAAAFALTVTGTTTVGGGTSGTLSISSATGAKSFADVTVSSGATWTNSANAAVAIGGNLANSGTFTAGSGTYTLSGSSKTISGTISIPSLTVTGTYANSGALTVGTLLTVTSPGVLTNNGTITATTALSGTGGLTQGASATLNIGGTSGITALTATASGNTVNYTGTSQTLKVVAYYHLTLSGGAETFGVIATISGNLTLSGSATATMGGNLTIGGNLSIGDGTTFASASTYTLGVTGTTTVGGGASGTFTLAGTGAMTFTSDVTINTGGLWNETAVAAYSFGGSLQNGGTLTANTGVHTFTGATKTFSGANAIVIPSVTVNGTYQNNGTLTVNTAFAGSGGLTQGTSATLNIGGPTTTAITITTLSASANVNTVNYTGAAQTLKNVNYYNLTLSGSGAKTLQTGTTTISGSLALSGTATATLVVGLAVSGNVTIGSGTTLDVSASNYSLSLGGNWSNGQTFTQRSGTVTFNGSGIQTVGGSVTTTFYALAIINSGTQLSLATGVSFPVTSLYIGGVNKALGTWGSTTSSATHQDNTDFAATTGTLNVSSGPSTTTTLARHSGTVTPSTYGTALSFDVSVTGSNPSGGVTLTDGGTNIGSGTLSGGSCMITTATTAVTAGTHANIVAVYAGDANNDSSTSIALSPSQVVNALAVQLSGTRTYDGTTEAASGILTIGNNLDGANLTLSGSATLASKNVGSPALSTRTVTRVNSATGAVGGSAATSFTVTVTAPTSGNTLIAVISTRSTSANAVSSISQTGATWSRVASTTGTAGTTTEIWYAPNVSSAGTTVTVNLGASLFAAAVVAEYSGVLSASPVDVTNTSTGNSASAVTGTTGTTAQGNELWIGGIGLVNSTYTLTSILNSFASVANVASTNVTAGNNALVYALEKIVTTTGTANSGGTVSTSSLWSGAIATFKTTPLALAGTAAANYTLTGLSGSVSVGQGIDGIGHHGPIHDL